MFSLSIIGSGGQFKPGLYNFITISSSSPAIVYYNFDDEEPSITNAYVYTEPVPVPHDIDQITIRAFAITSEGDITEMFVKTFISEEEEIRQPYGRKGPSDMIQDGIVILDRGETTDYIKGYDEEMDPTVYQKDPDEDYSEVFPDSQIIEISITPPDAGGAISDGDWVITSSPSDKFFNPKAKVIVINADDPDQVPNIIMRAFGSMRDLDKTYQGGELLEFDTYVSGSFMRRMYSSETGKTAAYYFDSNSLQYVIVERDLMPGEFSLNISHSQPWRRKKGVGLVFPWLYPGRGNIR